MSEKLPWYGEMQYHGWGPHFYLNMEFAAPDAVLLRALLRESPPADFVVSEFHRLRDSASEIEHWEISGSREWSYIFLKLDEAKLSIEHGWGTLSPLDSRWVVDVLERDDLTLGSWHIHAGGDGYGACSCARGGDGDSFLNYVAGERRDFDAAQIETALRRVLESDNPDDKFTLRELRENRGRLEAVMIYEIKRDNGQPWSYPADVELWNIGCKVSDELNVPFTVSALSIGDPNDEENYLGGSIYFGFKTIEPFVPLERVATPLSRWRSLVNRVKAARFLFLD